ncbi:MAG: rhomboid family intramembrane serine protease [Chitinispirillia bacterium]|jgi:membrane associated rhomboid family serine protease
MKSTLQKGIQTILVILLIFWVVEIINTILGHKFGTFGILPRNVVGLRGILLSPFIHHGIPHLVLNSIPFIILGSIVIMRGIGQFYQISVFIILIGGTGVWIFGRSALHAGASGLIFGYFGFLVAAGWYEKKIVTILIAVAVLFFYGGAIFSGILPTQRFVSWEGHLFGLLAGVLTAKILVKKKR